MKVFKVNYGLKLAPTKTKKAEYVKNFGKVNVLISDENDATHAIGNAKARIRHDFPTFGGRKYEIVAESVKLLVEDVR